MKIIHVVPQIGTEAAGPSYSVPRLCQAIADHGNEVVLSCLGAERPIPGVRTEVFPSWPILRGFEVSHRHAMALRKDAGKVDIIHNHSLWSMVNVAAGWVVPGQRAKLVTAPRGTLSEWALAHSRRRKQLVWPLQRRALLRADLLQATCEEEYADIRRLGLRAPRQRDCGQEERGEACGQAADHPRRASALGRRTPRVGQPGRFA